MKNPSDIINVALYADKKSRVEFSHAAVSEIAKDYRRFFGRQLRLIAVNASDVRSGTFFAEADVFVVPGIIGEISQYPEHMGISGKKNILDFVRRGKIYEGYCAGAGLALHRITHVTASGEIRIRKDDNFQLTVAHGFGPLKNRCKPDPATLAFNKEWHMLEPVPVEWENGIHLEIPYGLGPVFNTKADPDIIIRGRYADVNGKPPCDIQGTYGLGQFYLHGILPQFSHEHHPELTKGGVPESVQILYESLFKHRHARRAISDTKMQRMVSHLVSLPS